MTIRHGADRLSSVPSFVWVTPFRGIGIGTALAAVWLVVVVVAAVAPAVLTSLDPFAVEGSARLLGPSGDHLFGTDQLGRDTFARVVHGTGLSLSTAFLATVFGLVAGTVLGLLAGFLGGRADSVLMRLADTLLAIPALLLSLALIASLGPGVQNVALAVGVVGIATSARIVRAEVLRVRESPFVESAVASGLHPARVLLRHVLPNSLGPVWALAALEFAGALLAVSALSFLGYGAQPPTPEWGALVAEGRDVLASAWWLTTFPGVAVVLTVLAANRLAHAVEGRRA